MVNVKPVKLGNTERMSFGKIDEVIDILSTFRKRHTSGCLTKVLKKYLKMFRALPIIRTTLFLILSTTHLMLITRTTA